MKPRTRDFLEAATRHQQFASVQINMPTPPAWAEWAIIASFYSAVHYVNANLWENYEFEPRSHEESDPRGA